MSRYSNLKTTRATSDLQRTQLVRHLLQTTFGTPVYHQLPLSPAPLPKPLPPKPAAMPRPTLLAKLTVRKANSNKRAA